MSAIWRVEVATEIDAAARNALQRAGIVYVSGHRGGGTVSSTFVVRADTETEARHVMAGALGDVRIRKVEQTPIFVYAPIEPDARRAFEEAAADERISGVIEDQADGRLEVVFQLSSRTVDRAFKEARGLYRLVVESAGLSLPSRLEMRMSGFEAFFQSTRDRELLDRAHALTQDGHYDLAVIVSQTACEVLTADALRTLLAPHASDMLEPWLLEHVNSFTLIDDPTRRLWNQLTGSQIEQQGFWAAYRAHVKRRNNVVHRGEQVDGEAAQSSLETASAYFDYVETCLGSAPAQAA